MCNDSEPEINAYDDPFGAMDEAIRLVEQAQGLVDEVVSNMPPHIRARYEAYGRYGFNQLLGNGNPYDDGLHTIIEELDDIHEDGDEDEDEVE